MVKSNPAPSPQRPTHDEIAARAYEIYLREGRPAGREQEHWTAAEAELVKEKAAAQAKRGSGKVETVVKPSGGKGSGMSSSGKGVSVRRRS
jgi:hypothetical protein